MAVAEEEEEVKGCLMCQLIARKLERIALNDRADVVEGLKEGLRGEIGRFSSFFFFFFSRMKFILEGRIFVFEFYLLV